MPEIINIANAGPPTLDHVLGQRQAVAQLKIALAAFWNERAAGRATSFGSVLLEGPPGTGKTCLAKILASELGGTLKEFMGQTLAIGEDVHSILLDATADTCIYVDEADQMSSFSQTLFFRAVEEHVLLVPKGPFSNKYTTVPLSPFTLILATNHSSGILAPLRDRMSHVLHFEFYAPAELAAICKQRATAMRWSIEPEVFQLVAGRSKQTPRLALRLLQSCWRTARAEGTEVVTVEHYRRTLELEGLDADLGLNKAEQIYLKALADSEGKARLHLLATRIGQPSGTVAGVIESFLIRQGLVTREQTGRQLTQAGWEYVRRNYRSQ
jgi:Holliday junction DNA helicase RuvB